jgi:uncharacterized protein YceK
MKKRCVLLLLSMLIFASGCGSTVKTVDLTQVNTESEAINSEMQKEDTEQKEKLFDKDVDIILSMYTFDDTDINTYVEQLKADNPDDTYEVYDDSHYKITIKDSERKKSLEDFENKATIDKTFQDIFSDDQYGGAFLKMDYDDLFKNVTFYADKSAYDSAGISVVFGPLVISGMFSDSVQAYNLIPPEERSCTVKIVDNETGAVLYDSSENTSTEE